MYTIQRSTQLSAALASRGTHRLLLWLLATGWPLLLRGVRHNLQVRGQRFLACISRRFKIWYSVSENVTLYAKYRDRDEEAQYWRSSSHLRRSFGIPGANGRLINPDGSAETLGTLSEIPLVVYYTPLLPPLTRIRNGTANDDPEATEYLLSPKAFCKWHRMVFRGPLHPTLIEAKAQIRNYSSRDRQQIYRISRMLSDKEVFGLYGQRTQWSPRYRNIWKAWLESKGPDVAIVFR